MKWTGIAVLLFTLTGVLINDVKGGPAPRQQEAAPPEAAAGGGHEAGMADALQRELAGMRLSLQEITILLAAALEHQELSVLMSRIELKQRRLQPLETALLNARKERRGMTEEEAHHADMLEMFEDQAGTHANDPEAMEREDLMKREASRSRKRLDRLASLIDALDLRIIELEDDLARNEDDIAILEELIDERLGLR